ncbi:MAG: YbaN family protein [Deltaproteobacteria bacterium]|nr:YbaN family protein [Deltaproteobacteria bacterium]
MIRHPVRILGLAVAFVLLALSIVSFVVPVLPTVPLLIATCWLFSKCSTRWHQWLLANPRLGPPLRTWEEQGAIELRVKLVSTIIMSACLFYPVFVSRTVAFPARVWMVTVALLVFGFLWSRPGVSTR